jgi:catechol 2,3-dioxygenase-like lactoylglutathione lyase family enzyme
MPAVASLDHLVLTATDVDRTIAFYTQVLGMVAEQFQLQDGSIRWALKFGTQKINLHPADAPFAPHAKSPTVGSADLCFLTNTGLEEWCKHFAASDVVGLEGPIARTGATGPIMSVYINDPDGALIEVSVRNA